MRRIFLLITALFLSTIQTYATNWVPITNDNKNFIDTESIEYFTDTLNYRSTNKYSFWTKSLNDKTQLYTFIEKNYHKKPWYKLNKQVVDCTNKKLGLESLIVYDLKEQVITSDEYNILLSDWHSIVPDSYGELLYDVVCKSQKIE
ncbi:MAG: hypothetical protein PHV37_05960 [Candidatus Gastranaerophilales bacterium]|nr:hypothetical protein [Candidatus Gastranaerophilales bacterium]